MAPRLELTPETVVHIHTQNGQELSNAGHHLMQMGSTLEGLAGGYQGATAAAMIAKGNEIKQFGLKTVQRGQEAASRATSWAQHTDDLTVQAAARMNNIPISA